ncbi:TetR/AcrR family transcriptional regulator [[Mycobacterium] zoologicum]|uniref:TetR/AcrR family transcriptional regulator n=1 Tax=[Mycobacterium] zoologicum TaxID=2872311 RepID=UPI002CAC09E6|nr:TetR/AcrR family transcriptional regulator [Mycolicibacter sp. MYC101]MEB3065652.1 TetR/AcrR family transcriptional regulator [Mycolicibacter sp. MYC101]
MTGASRSAVNPVVTAKSAVTRRAILDAAREVFVRKGYSGTRVMDIAARLHVTRANFYYYFHDKQQLFIELGTEAYRESLTAIKAFDELGASPAITEVLVWVSNYFDYLERNGAFVARSIGDLPDDPTFTATVARLHKRAARTLGEHIVARSSAELSSPVSLGITVMAMLERSWLLVSTADVPISADAAIRSNAEILTQLMR